MVEITGGFISKQLGSNVKFVTRCEKCGCSEHPEILISLLRGVTEITTKECSKCGNNQRVKMKLVAS